MLSEQVTIPTLLSIAGVLFLLLNSEGPDSSSQHFLHQLRGHARRLPDKSHVRTRLEQLGRQDQYESFRVKQLTVAAICGAGSFLITLLVTTSPVLSFFSICLAFIGAFLFIDHKLSAEVVRNRSRIESEFASIVEMLTLSLSAGESPLGAMTRISQRSSGLLAYEFDQVIMAVRNGAPFHVALDALGRRVDSVVIRRFVDALITAMLRGAPLVDVLQRHAAEARASQRNLLMDKAGKAELSMMIPVVFLILPISVLFALWPSITHLSLFAT